MLKFSTRSVHGIFHSAVVFNESTIDTYRLASRHMET